MIFGKDKMISYLYRFFVTCCTINLKTKKGNCRIYSYQGRQANN